jgi:histo-blood group ABO system transferase
MSVGIIVIATGRYRRFLPQLVESAESHVSGLERIFALVDDDRSQRLSPLVTTLPWDHSPWPLPTLLRYKAIARHSQAMTGIDCLVYVDVDMRFVAPFELPSLNGLFAVQHPGCVDRPRDQLPFERDPLSRAFVPFGSGDRYVCGGVQGGDTRRYLTACAEMARWIDDERASGRVPIWHDESIWNRWCIEHPPELVLPANYCWPEHRPDGDPVLIALDKTHAYWRAGNRRSAGGALLEAYCQKVRMVLRRLYSGRADRKFGVHEH